MKTVGILGGGQLGCLLADALFQYGAKVHIYDPDHLAPGQHRTPSFTCAAWDDEESLRSFLNEVDVVTFEFENVKLEKLRKLIDEKPTVPHFMRPSLDVLQTTQSRQAEKAFLVSQNLPCAPFVVVETLSELNNVSAKLGGSSQSFVAKTLRGGYDGKGQIGIENGQDISKKIGTLTQMLPLVLEEKVKLCAEASVIVGRNRNGVCSAFPPFENIHENHILFLTQFPTVSFTPQLNKAMLDTAKMCAEKLGVVGLLTVEFFIAKEPAAGVLPGGNLQQCGDFYFGVNEFAPRPHNSGHITRSAAACSQFDLHARTLLDIPLPAQSQLNPRAPGTFVMLNLLGDLWSSPEGNLKIERTLSQFTHIEEITLYGKALAKAGRKMGHLNLHFASETTPAALHEQVTLVLSSLRSENQ